MSSIAAGATPVEDSASTFPSQQAREAGNAVGRSASHSARSSTPGKLRRWARNPLVLLSVLSLGLLIALIAVTVSALQGSNMNPGLIEPSQMILIKRQKRSAFMPADSGLFKTSIQTAVHRLTQLLHDKTQGWDEKTITDSAFRDLNYWEIADHTNRVVKLVTELEEGAAKASNEEEALATRVRRQAVGGDRTEAASSTTEEEYVRKVRESLDKLFFNPADEVTKFNVDSDVFTIRPDSTLQRKLNELKAASNTNKNDVEEMEEMVTEALKTFAQLYRNLAVLPSANDPTDPVLNTELEDYTAGGLDSFLEKVDLVFNGKGSVDRDLAGRVDLGNPVHRSWRYTRSSLIPMQLPVLVPGGRFVEGYYWDTYWIIKGLCKAGLVDQATQMLHNFFSAIDRFGFIPNGFRRYYLDRSQPPFLAMSVRAVLDTLEQDSEKHRDLVVAAIPRLLKEYLFFWMNPSFKHIVRLDQDCKEDKQWNSASFRITDVKNSKFFYLNRYYSAMDDERPESFAADHAMVQAALQHNFTTDKIKSMLRSIRSAAESGWDFSSRWSRYYFDPEISPEAQNRNAEHTIENYFLNIDTTHILPVDLNAVLHENEKQIQYLFDLLLVYFPTSTSKDRYVEFGKLFEALASRRGAAMSKCMRNDKGVMVDYDFLKGKTSRVISVASLVPFWLGIQNLDNAVDTFKEILRAVKGKEWGVVPTAIRSGQQWDTPNVWPPLIDIAITAAISSKGTENDGVRLLKDFVKSAIADYKALRAKNSPGYFYEKYNADTKPGVAGGGGRGGEYENQTGFGWTNGALLSLIALYGHFI